MGAELGISTDRLHARGVHVFRIEELESVVVSKLRCFGALFFSGLEVERVAAVESSLKKPVFRRRPRKR